MGYLHDREDMTSFMFVLPISNKMGWTNSTTGLLPEILKGDSTI
jgi:hypothetical protein